MKYNTAFGIIVALFITAFCLLFAQAQQPQRKLTPDELRQMSAQYKFAACQIDSQLLADESAAKDAKIAKLEKELAESKQGSEKP